MKIPKKSIFLILALLGAAGALAVLLDRLASAPKTIAHGCFHQVAHRGAGCATLVEKRDGQTILRLTDFKTTDKEDLHILLISAPDAFENETVKRSERVYVAPLARAEGPQQYPVPAGVELENFRAVVIWNGKHGVNFTTAPLERF